jgi:hypothetical protein
MLSLKQPPLTTSLKKPNHFPSSNSSMMSRMLFGIVSFLAVANVVASQWVINSLPGFSGNLPFKLETGLMFSNYFI